MSAAASVRCDGLVHIYGSAGQEVSALRGVDFEVGAGETVALLGPSGAGKSTLLWILAGLMKPTAGLVEVGGRNVAKLSGRQAAAMRLRDIGVVMQTPARNLLPYDTALGNVLFVQSPTRRTHRSKRLRAHALLEAVGLGGHANRTAGRMSGGEQQRLAVAVALANGPSLLLADEPTSQLDRVSAQSVLELIKGANADLGTTVVAVTHDADVGALLGRTVTIRDGRVGMEGRAGEEYLVVGRDGTVQIPSDMLDILPPGSLAEARRTPDGIQLRPVESDDRS